MKLQFLIPKKVLKVKHPDTAKDTDELRENSLHIRICKKVKRVLSNFLTIVGYLINKEKTLSLDS